MTTTTRVALDWTAQEVVEIAAGGASTAGDVKRRVEEATGVPAARIKLSDARTGRELCDDDKCRCDSTGGANLVASAALAGGCGTTCCGCVWWGPLFRREDERSGKVVMGCCEIQ